jgi:hypothetical protein
VVVVEMNGMVPPVYVAGASRISRPLCPSCGTNRREGRRGRPETSPVRVKTVHTLTIP